MSFFLVQKMTKKWISWGENCKFLDFFDPKKKKWKNHFFLVSPHKQDFFQKTRKMTFSVQQIDKKWSQKLRIPYMSMPIWSKNGHFSMFSKSPYVDNGKKAKKWPKIGSIWNIFDIFHFWVFLVVIFSAWDPLFSRFLDKKKWHF